MVRRRVVTALLLLNVLAPAADIPAFRANVRLVKADVSVYDRRSRAAIAGLQATDFQVFDGDQQREIAYFGEESGPVDLLFLLDVSGSVREILPAVADAAVEALSVFEGKDRAAAMAFSRKTALTERLTPDFAAVAEGIRAAASVQIGLDTDINQAVWAAATYLRGAGGSNRRAILVLTDNMQETRVRDGLIDEQLAEAGAVLDGFLLRGPVALPRFTHPGVFRFARNSGGEVLEGNRPAARLAEMIRRIKSRYSIHFRPVDAPSAAARSIRIDLSPEARRRYPDAVVRSRRVYFPQRQFRPKPALPAGQTIAAAPGSGSGAVLL